MPPPTPRRRAERLGVMNDLVDKARDQDARMLSLIRRARSRSKLIAEAAERLPIKESQTALAINFIAAKLVEALEEMEREELDDVSTHRDWEALIRFLTVEQEKTA